MISKSVLRLAFESKVNVLKALFRRPPILPGDSLVLFDSVLGVVVIVALEGNRCPWCDGYANNGGGGRDLR